jgi:lysophospholipase L1-like esterase
MCQALDASDFRRWATALAMVSGATLCAAPALAQRMPTHVACVGDSITYGYGASSQTMTSYPADLQKMFASGVKVQNFGHNGATLLSNASLPYIKQPEYTAATTFVDNAGANAVVDVVIMLGTNDAYPGNWMNGTKATQFQMDYAALIDHFSNLSAHPTVYVALPPPAYPNNASNISGTIMQDSIVPLTTQVAAQKGAPVIDANTAMMGQPQLFGDGLHPTDKGYTVLANVVYDGLLHLPRRTGGLTTRLRRIPGLRIRLPVRMARSGTG